MVDNPESLTGKRIKLINGQTLEVTVEEYDSSRKPEAIEGLNRKALCYAPFVNLYYFCTGGVMPCNHTFGEVGNISNGKSLLEVWRGEEMRAMRRRMQNYELDPKLCAHCVHQIRTRQFNHAFSAIEFDNYATSNVDPEFPKILNVMLENICNLGCIMCDPFTSSTFRRNDGYEPLESPTDESLMKELELIAPHLEHVRFFGGEPFLGKWNLKLLEILSRDNHDCSIFMVTNCSTINPKTLKYFETLKCTGIGISLDAIDDELHSEIRCGLDTDRFWKNLKTLRAFGRRKKFPVFLQVTEHRKNWFELPEIFKWAVENRMNIHVNHCVSPDNVTLYTLPNDELELVLNHLRWGYERLHEVDQDFLNCRRYEYLLGLVEYELNGRDDSWRPLSESTSSSWNKNCDGLLGAPHPGVAPFDSHKRVEEIGESIKKLNYPTRSRLLSEMVQRIRDRLVGAQWEALSEKFEN